MPEFTGGQPEEYYAQHKELADEQDTAQSKADQLKADLKSETEDYEQRRTRGDRDAADYRPYEPGFKQAIEGSEEKAGNTQKLIDAQAELGKTHYEVNEAGYRQEAAGLDAQRIQDIAARHSEEDE